MVKVKVKVKEKKSTNKKASTETYEVINNIPMKLSRKTNYLELNYKKEIIGIAGNISEKFKIGEVYE